MKSVGVFTPRRTSRSVSVAATIVIALGLIAGLIFGMSSPASAENSFSILNTIWYWDGSSDRDDTDAALQAGEEIQDHFLDHGWSQDQYWFDNDVTAHRYTNPSWGATRSDFLYSGSHGGGDGGWISILCLHDYGNSGAALSSQHLLLKDTHSTAGDGICNYSYPYTSKWKGDDSSESKDIEWAWLWACGTLSLDPAGYSKWPQAFDQGLNLVLGYRDSIPGVDADNVAHDVCTLMWGEGSSPYDRDYSIWSAYIFGNTALNDRDEWAIDGDYYHRWDWIHGATVPPGNTNRTPYEYGENNIYQWNEENYGSGGEEISSIDQSPKRGFWASLGKAIKDFFVPAGAYAESPLALADGSVRVTCPLSEETPALKSVSITPNMPDVSSVANALLDPSYSVRNLPETTTYSDDYRDLVAWSQGRVTLTREMAGVETATALSYKEAKTEAEAYIQQAGGLPPEYQLESASTIDQVSLHDPADHKSLAWKFRYTPEYNGLEVVSAGGAGVSAIFSDDGLYCLNRWCPDFQEEGTSVAREVLSAEEALTAVAPDLARAFGLDSVDVNSVELVYFCPNYQDCESGALRELKPAYRILRDGSDFAVLVDAYSGSILVQSD